MMLSAIRKRLTYANVAMTLALVFAMSGGAYAASKVLITSTKQISPKVLKSLKGANGTNGAAGPAGVVGAAGATGPGGPQGPQGPAGTNGEPGKNGTNGTNGQEGSPWTAGGTLPGGKTETGSWTVSVSGEGTARMAAISFPIRLAKALGPKEVHFIGNAATKHTACPGTVAEPEAEPGNLCVYETGMEGTKRNSEGSVAYIFPSSGFLNLRVSKEETTGAGTAGAVLFFEGEGSVASGWGSWAVTAPE